MQQVRIKLQNISKYYYSETAVTQALQGINLEFRMGEFVAITGESGSGKSTLLRIISGMDTFDDGELYVDGQPTFQYDEDDWEEYRRTKIGFVFQDYSLIGHYTAKENIVSALLIMGVPEKEAGDKAIHYLERVGLSAQRDQRASKLSSGQKQRLSIARALAKDTDIIVADEPTGNLDSETGAQIVKLLRDLSQDHLVIMVTHNYEQVEKYVTRKVRLHDGSLILDVSENMDTDQKSDVSENTDTDQKLEVSENMDTEQKPEMSENVDNNEKTSAGKKSESNEERLRDHTIGRIFVRMNAVRQPEKIALFMGFFLAAAIVSFLFIGQLLMNADDIYTKEYSATSFARKDDKRISLRRKDQKFMTKKDIDRLTKMKHVVSVDQYDIVNDINYYFEEGKDYRQEYGYNRMSTSDEGWMYDSQNVEYVKKDQYMRSSSCLKKSDLAKGSLPKKIDEVVLYDRGKYKVGDTITFFYTSDVLWSSTENYIQRKMKVSGLLKNKDKQVYFSPEICTMLQSTVTGGKVFYEYAYNQKLGKYQGQAALWPIVGDIVKKDNELCVSGAYEAAVYRAEDNDLTLLGQSGLLHIDQYDKDMKSKDVKQIENVETGEKINGCGANFAEVSQDIYEKYYRTDSRQASVYITSYAKMDHVLKALDKAGYEAVSTLRFGADKYDSDLVQERLRTIGIAVAILLVMMAAEILILRSIFKIQIKDQKILKFMGMSTKLIGKINYMEMRRYSITAIIVVAVVMNVVGIFVPALRAMLYYYEWPGYLAYFMYNYVAAMVMVAAFNHLLKGKVSE
ncbi:MULTISPECIES: ABC transporter ATP-binding protein [unclassified Clostridium]|uniref:ABC transporter ATP-binding protein n=1 Tax=unclassified Clostridium TaxID=2614128 RepID=UPI0015FDF5D8|nr:MULTISPECIES: ABC transporter ATP-binding protein [unclassified Clostridium]